MTQSTQPQTALAVALATAGVTTIHASNESRFDPLAFVEDKIAEPELRTRILTNAVWALDQEIVNTGVSMYFDLRRENPECKDVQQLVDAFTGAYDHEGFWGEGNAHLLVQLLSMQPAWHDDAIRAAHTSGWVTYMPKTIDELVLSIKAMPISGDAMANTKALAKLVAEQTDGAMTEEQAIQMSLKNKAERAAQQAEFKRGLNPAIHVFVELAQSHIRGNERDVEFYDLPIRSQLSIATKMRDGNVRAREDLSGRLDNTTFMLCLGESVNAGKVLTRVVDRLVAELERTRN